MKSRALVAVAAVALIAAVGVFANPARNVARAEEQISGAGSTFVNPVLSKWADAYHKATGIALNYQSIGSGGGIKQVEAKTVTFGATDAPLKADELDKYGLIQFPVIMGGIVPVVNVPGIKPGMLVLDGKALAGIYLGTITNWNDQYIKYLNPTQTLPDLAISVVHRSDGSGTTFNFTYYLAAVSADWKSKVGVDKSVEWPVGIGQKGNEGVAATVGQTSGSIGYVEFAYATANNLTYCGMVNKAGKRLEPSIEAFASAATNADWSSVPGFGVIIANQGGDKTWPMAASTWVLVYKNPNDGGATKRALDFFKWAYSNGDDMAKGLYYVPIPTKVVTEIEKTWAGIE
jgi:phosphate transport system substrate-binding protein